MSRPDPNAFPIPFLVVSCFCERDRSGRKFTVTYKTLSLVIEYCYGDCFSKDYLYIHFVWDTHTHYQDDGAVSQGERIEIPGGYSWNESDASFKCEQKCQELNSL
jgi:hypothetical protein